MFKGVRTSFNLFCRVYIIHVFIAYYVLLHAYQHQYWQQVSFSDMDNNLVRISKSLHNVLDMVLGTEPVVVVRRRVTEFRDEIFAMEQELRGMTMVPIYSGSKAEGYRFRTSDDDWMFVYKNIRVIPDHSYSALYDSGKTLLVMENEMTKPGFTLLRSVDDTSSLVLQTNRIGFFPFATVPLLNGRYVASRNWREFYTKISKGQDIITTHGPCTSGLTEDYEFDWAYCLKSEIWPENARACINRLHQSSWLPRNTICNIARDGVLFVAIGAKQSFFENTEWRMSFSLAEKKLMHSMNYTQFLCYGLMKSFLKEAIDSNPQVKGLLCSYFLKTALFWEITSSPSNWNPSSLLTRFWNCFRRLLQWINCSFCPNFFIPENNMFEGKIEGANRAKLLQHLNSVYLEGFRCLLRCPSLSKMRVIINVSNSILLPLAPSNSRVAGTAIAECLNMLGESPPRDGNMLFAVLHHLTNTSDDSLENHFAKIWLHKLLTRFCLSEYNKHSAGPEVCNKPLHRDHVRTLKIMATCRTDTVCYQLHQAQMCYQAGNFRQALTLVQRASEAVLSSHTIYMHGMTDKNYEEAGGEHLSIEQAMRKFLIDELQVIQSLPELYIEINDRHNIIDPREPLIVPPIIYAFFLQFLCYNKLGCPQERDISLYALSRVVHDDDEYHIKENYRAISWQILGICQQISHDDQAACRSYVMALRTNKWSTYRRSSCIRLATVLAPRRLLILATLLFRLHTYRARS